MKRSGHLREMRENDKLPEDINLCFQKLKSCKLCVVFQQSEFRCDSYFIVTVKLGNHGHFCVEMADQLIYYFLVVLHR